MNASLFDITFSMHDNVAPIDCCVCCQHYTWRQSSLALFGTAAEAARVSFSSNRVPKKNYLDARISIRPEPTFIVFQDII
mmetsp:Transcript_22184/g.25523  ORF Transcript_22184/g.25523 Transcript_22184/m.25523 type:complete len:80 (-) Transcript_22184:923-1162(-)